MQKKICLALCVAVFLAASGLWAQAQEEVVQSPQERRQALLPVYEALKQDARFHELRQLHGQDHRNADNLDAYLRYMPISPLEFLEIDMWVKKYEYGIPKFIAEQHARWIAIHEDKARKLYGDVHVDSRLAGWPVDTGNDALADKATVGTNRNAAATFSPSPQDYQGEIQVVVNPNNANQIVAAANTWDDIGGTCGDGIQAVFYSNDGGVTWGYSCPPGDAGYTGMNCSGLVFGSDPALAWNDNNEVFLNYMLLCNTGSTAYSMVVARSSNGGATWTGQGIIKNSWGTGDLEDKNFYLIDNNPTSPYYGRHYTCWDRNNNEKMAYSTNNGSSWTEVDLPTSSGNGTGSRFDLGCDLAITNDGTVHIVFNTLSCLSTCNNEEMFYTRSTNGGASWSSPVEVRDFNLVGFSNSNCPDAQNNRCIGPFGGIAADTSGGACDGNLYATFTDYTSGGVNNSDVWLSRSTNNGASWSAPIVINDDGLSNRVQFHPFVQVDASNGHVVVGWHDARNDAGNDAIDYMVARSTDCGVSFEANIQASQPSSEFNNSGISYSNENTTDNPNYNPNQYGEYMGVDAMNGKAYLAWSDTRHFFPGSSSNSQKENLGFAIVEFDTGTGPVCGNNTIEGSEVCDGTDLGGETCQSQGFSSGTLACNATCSAFDTSSCSSGGTPQTGTFTSIAGEDGWVREQSENSNTGSATNTTGGGSRAIRAGDATNDRQYKAILSFDTSSIPAGATIQSVTLRLFKGGNTGTNPFNGGFGNLNADANSGGFGGNTALQSSDFQAAATAAGVCTLPSVATNNWSECTFNAAGNGAINTSGTTQVRIAFDVDDNDDGGNDFAGFYSGNNSNASRHPQLVVTYLP